MNRSILKYAFVLLGTAAVVSCNKRLDVLPTQSIDQSQALSTSKDVEVTLIGAYDGMQSTSVYGGAIQYTADLLGSDGDIRFGGTFQNLLEIANRQMTTVNATAADIWVQSYVAINRANNVLSALDKVEAAKKGRVEGEARFIRGSLYFELARLYGKAWGDGDNNANPAVPLVLEPTQFISDKDFRARNSVAEVYAQAIADLTKAEELLPAANTIYATKGAAAGQLSRIYLMQGNYAGARDAANRVINLNRYTLVPNFANLFFTYLTNGGANPSEYIFSMVVTTQDGGNGMNTYYGTTVSAIPGTSGRGDFRILNSHVNLYEPNDVRGQYFFTSAQGLRFTRKHLDRFGNVPVIRLAEMYLTRAEANFRLGTSLGAAPLADVNAIRTRAGLAGLTALTLDAILKERRLELAFEGHSLHDYKRTRRNVGAEAWNSSKLVFPVPQRERDVNSKLVQNEGYN